MNPPDATPPTVPVPPELPGKRDRVASRRFMVAVFVVLSLPLLSWGAYLLHRASVSSDVGKTIRARNEPLTLTELAAAQPTVPEDQNAALALIEVWRTEDPAYWGAFLSRAERLPAQLPSKVDPSLPLLGKYDVPLPESGPLPEPMRELIAAHVAKRAEHRAAVRKTIQLPRSLFPVRYTDGYQALLPHIAWLKKEQNEFHLEFIDAVERRDTVTALSSLESLVRVSHLLAGEPTLIGQLIRIRGYQEALTGIGRLLSAGPLDAIALERLEKMVVGLTTIDAFRQTLVSERAMALDVLELSADGYASLSSSDNPIELPWFFRVMWVSGMTVIDRARLLESSEQLLGMVDMDPILAAANWEALVNGELSGSGLQSLCPVTNLIFRGTRNVGPKFASMEGRRRVALIVIAVERFRAANGGRLPDGLEDLPAPADDELWEDPYDDELIYRPLPEGYAVYSVGPDRKDDGGRPPRRKASPALPADDVITVRR